MNLASGVEYDHTQTDVFLGMGLNEKGVEAVAERIVSIIIDEGEPTRIIQKIEDLACSGPKVLRAMMYLLLMSTLNSGMGLTTGIKRHFAKVAKNIDLIETAMAKQLGMLKEDGTPNEEDLIAQSFLEHDDEEEEKINTLEQQVNEREEKEIEDMQEKFDNESTKIEF